MVDKETQLEIVKQVNKIIPTLPPNVLRKFLYGSKDDKRQIFAQYILPNIPTELQLKILDQHAKHEKQERPNEVLSALLEISESDILRLIIDPKYRRALLNAFDQSDKVTISDNIFAFGNWPVVKPPLFRLVKHSRGDTIVANKKAFTQRELIDFSRLIVIGDFDCCMFDKKPKSDEEANAILKLLPYAVLGKLDCHRWDRDLFKRISMLPYADTIDCSFSISALSDLLGKLRPGLKELIVEDKFLKNANVESAKAFLEAHKTTHPNLVLTSPKSSNLKLSLAIIAEMEAKKRAEEEQKSAEAVATKALTDSAPKKKNTAPDPKIHMPLNDAYNKFIRNTGRTQLARRDFEKFIKQIFGELKIKTFNGQKYIAHAEYPDIEIAIVREIKFVVPLASELNVSVNDIRPIVSHALEKSYDDIKKLVEQHINDDTTEQDKKENLSPLPQDDKKIPQAKESVTDYVIIKYLSLDILKQLSPQEQQELRQNIKLFNLLNQQKIWNSATYYVDTDGQHKSLQNFKTKNIQTFVYGRQIRGASRIVFKSTLLTDESGTPILDAQGRKTYILVSTKHFANHGKEQKGYNHYLATATLSLYQEQNYDGSNIVYIPRSVLDDPTKYEKYEWPEPGSPSKEQSNDTIKDATTIDKNSVHELPADATFKPVFEQQTTSISDKFAKGIENVEKCDEVTQELNDIVAQLFGSNGKKVK